MVTALQDKRLLWISAEPFNFAEWPLLSVRYKVEARSFGDALPGLSRDLCKAIVLSFPASGRRPDDVVERVQRAVPGVPVLIHDPSASPSDAVRLARLGV